MKARRPKHLDPRGPLAENAARIVKTRLEELRSFAPAALEAGASREQHDMRIAAKRLRYVLEIIGFCLGNEAEEARHRARDLQDVLGELHDCDVMLPRVAAHVEERSAPELAPGLEQLRAHLETRRGELFDRFREFWDAEEGSGTWEALERAAKARR